MKLFFRKIGTGKPLIILHGLFGMSDNWLTIARRIARRHTVYIPDQRNHGQSPHSDDFSYDILAQDLDAFIKEQNLERIRLIGHSMGGKVAMNYALGHGEKVEKLVVVDIAPRVYQPTQFKRFFEAMRSVDLAHVRTRGEIDTHLSHFISQPAIRQFLLKNLKRDAGNRFAWKINVEGIYKNIDVMFRGIEGDKPFNGDVLFVRGGRSDYILSSDIPLIKKMFPASEVVSIPSASHWIHSDSPEEFCNHLRTFLLS